MTRPLMTSAGVSPNKVSQILMLAQISCFHHAKDKMLLLKIFNRPDRFLCNETTNIFTPPVSGYHVMTVNTPLLCPAAFCEFQEEKRINCTRLDTFFFCFTVLLLCIHSCAFFHPVCSPAQLRRRQTTKV